jgi:hypothetical protein
MNQVFEINRSGALEIIVEKTSGYINISKILLMSGFNFFKYLMSSRFREDTATFEETHVDVKERIFTIDTPLLARYEGIYLHPRLYELLINRLDAPYPSLIATVMTHDELPKEAYV